MVASVLASKSPMRSSSLPAMTCVGSSGLTIHASASSGMPGAGVMEGGGRDGGVWGDGRARGDGRIRRLRRAGGDRRARRHGCIRRLRRVGVTDVSGVSDVSGAVDVPPAGGVCAPPAGVFVVSPVAVLSALSCGGVSAAGCWGASFAGCGTSVAGCGTSVAGGGASIAGFGASVAGFGASAGGAAAGCGVSAGGAGGWPSPPSAKANVVSRQMANRAASRRFISRSLPSFRRAGRGGAVFLYTRRPDMAFGCHSQEKLWRTSRKRRFALPVEANFVDYGVFVQREQEHHRVGYLRGADEAVRGKVRAGDLSHVRVDAAGADDMHAHAIFVKFVGQRLGKAEQGVLGGGIGAFAEDSPCAPPPRRC